MHIALNKTLASIPDDTKVYVRPLLSQPTLSLTEQPGHEYTKANVKFAASVSQSEPIKKLQAFAENNKETQGKFTIGDEKVSGFPNVNESHVLTCSVAQRLYENGCMFIIPTLN